MSSADNPQQVSRGLLITLGVVMGLAALYALYVFVVSPLLEEEPEPDIVATPQPGEVAPGDPDAPGATPAPEGTETELPDVDVVPETFEIFTARDPFQQLVVEAPAPASGTPTDGTVDNNVDGTDGTGTGGTGTGGTGTGTGTGTGGTGTGTDGTGTGDGGDDGNGAGMGGGDMTDGTGAGGETAPDSAAVGSTTIELTDVFVDDDGEAVALVTVNGRTYEVREGDVFADRFQVLDIDGVCAAFLFGDSRFTLCEGESIVK